MILMAGALAGISAPLQASDDRAQARAIEGVWEPIVTIRDCQSQTVLDTFPSMDSYVSGGSLIVGASSTPANRATGLGAWRHAGGRYYTAAYRFYSYDADGNPAGALQVSSTIRLNAKGTAFTAADTFEVSDLGGTVVFQGCGTRVAKRLF
jgi:hypothetical protein